MLRFFILLLLLPLVFSVGCETTSEKTEDSESEPISDEDEVVIPADDLEPMARFLFETRRVIAAEVVRIEITSQYFEGKMGLTRDLRYVERKRGRLKDGTRVIQLTNKNTEQETNIDPDLLPRVFFGDGLEVRAYKAIRIYLRDSRTKEHPLFFVLDARSGNGYAKMWVTGRLEKEQPRIRIRSELLWDENRERYVHKANID